jgi:hypothetical protein
MSNEPEELVLPEIKPKKVKKPYTVSEAVRARNRKGTEAYLRNKANNERKLREYEEIIRTRSVVKNEVEELLNDKIVNKIEQSMTAMSFRQPPAPLEIIQEESESESESGNRSDSEKRKNPRFQRSHQPQSPKMERFRRF